MYEAPSFLRPGDRIALIAPARCVTRQDILPFVSWAEKKGWEVVYSEALFQQWGQLAGTDEIRIAQLQAALDSDVYHAVWAAAGGTGTLRLLDKILWDKAVPKWIVGFSDITGLLWAALKKGWQALHAPVAKHIPSAVSPQTLTYVQRALQGEPLSYTWQTDYAQSGIAEGILIGGNLSLVSLLLCTPWMPPWENVILFLEEVDEYTYHLDRLWWKLYHAGILSQVKGVIVGSHSKVHEHPVPYPLTWQACVMDYLKNFSFPWAMDFPAGHEENNFPLFLGRQVVLQVAGGQATLMHL
ncbi:MAG: S66 peptidase family protein [Bacteroidia bacterium]